VARFALAAPFLLALPLGLAAAAIGVRAPERRPAAAVPASQ
jgi:hypothetical protein